MMASKFYHVKGGRPGWRAELSNTTGSERTNCEAWGKWILKMDVKKIERTMKKK
jgi:hypothetical protein